MKTMTFNPTQSRQSLLPNLRRLLQLFFSEHRRGVSGVSAVEFAIIAPVILLLAVATIDIGSGLHYKMQTEDAAQAGAQYAMTHGFNAANIADAVKSATGLANINASPAPTEFCGCPSGGAVTAINCNDTCPSGDTLGLYVAVSAQATYQTLIPYPIVPDTYNLTSTSTVRLQ